MLEPMRFLAILAVVSAAACGSGAKDPNRGSVTVCPGALEDAGADDGGDSGAGADGGAGECIVAQRPKTMECENACESLCDSVSECGLADHGACIVECFRLYAAPGETLGHDRAICDALLEEVQTNSCAGNCVLLEDGWQFQGQTLTCCPDGQQLAQGCAKCGPTDACEEVETFCAPSCAGPEDCEDDEDCRGGACVPFGSLCG